MGDKLFKIVGTALAVGSGALAKKVSEGGWKAVMASDPPANPEDPDTKLVEAVLWAAASGAIIALARMLATRQWTQYYAKSAGHKPANPNDVS
ncbi:DUF4235 domain-containing protein [Mobilicoccus pelagius]|uniref:DUF4235 domain-containing protein n=1 Tax=Mobilicoccus pelagius NBRC 104925 TaxID=1089455 RepID=H5UT69_9MICO|nr:DUF4235 domain-containing protein [Mobilicoccus pelagius]GAB48927.1 hypothetical protein MOPEL_085_00130 [Mobilicoccus pelagius NBRC 104925]